MPWYAMGLSIMATQASAITFISTTAQAYVDGMRFVQFYFGLPLAMVILSATAVPIFHRAKVYTAYEYLEYRFDAKTRLLVTIVFLISRGLQAGLALSAPAIVLSVILGWPFRVTILIMGGLVVLYTTLGGIKAVTWADVQQMAMIMLALVLAFAVAISMLPKDVSFFDAVEARRSGRQAERRHHHLRLERPLQHLERVDRRNVSGAGVLRNRSKPGAALLDRKIHRPKPPGTRTDRRGESAHAVFHPVHRRDGVRGVSVRAAAAGISTRGDGAGPGVAPICRASRAATSRPLTSARPPRAGSWRPAPGALQNFRAAQTNLDAARADALQLSDTNDTNYIFMSFVTHYLPVGSSGW